MQRIDCPARIQPWNQSLMGSYQSLPFRAGLLYRGPLRSPMTGFIVWQTTFREARGISNVGSTGATKTIDDG
jgi:hypothetical protein